MNHDRLMSISIGLITDLMEDEESAEQWDLSVLKNNPALFEEWKKYHSREIEKTANAKNKMEQILELRDVTLRGIECNIMSIKFLEYEEPDQKILAEFLNKGESMKEVIALEAHLYVVNHASCRCYRVIAAMLGDAKENDWYAMYNDLYSQHVLHLYEEIVAKGKNETYALGPLVRVSKSMIDEVRPKILEGANWDYDKEKIEVELNKYSS